LNDENLCVALFRRFDAALDIFLHGGHNHAVHVENQRERTVALGMDSARENREQA